MLRTADLDFKYPDELIATQAKPRGESRILKIPRDNDQFEELTWPRFLAHFKSGDTLVLNDSRVLWARLLIPKKSGATGEIFFLKSRGKIWEVLAKGLNLKEGKVLDLPGDVKAKVIKNDRIAEIEILSGLKLAGLKLAVGEGESLNADPELQKYFEKYGHVPLPPYIERQD